MYVTEIEITDLRCFRGHHAVSLDRGNGTYAGWTVFAGRNGSGKSTLLKAIALSLVGPLQARSLAGSFPAWVRKDSQVARVGTRIDFDKERDTFLQGRNPKTSFWSGLEWKANPGGSDLIERWTGKEPQGRQRILERGPWADSPRGWFAAGYGPYRHLGPMTAEIVQKSADPVLARLINLFNEAASLSDAVDWLKQTHLRALEEKPGSTALRDDVLKLLDDGLLPDGSTVDHVDSDGLWLTRDNVTLPLEQVSDGYRTMSALVVDIVRRLHSTYGNLHLVDDNGHLVCPLPGVVLIDEADAHLHLVWQQNLGFWLTSRFPAIQFLVTTHSPFICQAASPKGIIRLPAPGENDTIRHVADNVFDAIVSGGADDIVTTELFGLEYAHTPASEDLRNHVADLEIKVIDGLATEKEKSEYHSLKSRLPDSLGGMADMSVRKLLARGACP